MAACLLVKDDNLVEWLAFHAHTLPLGALIVAIDPTSQASQVTRSVLQRWNDIMHLSVWEDESDYMTLQEKKTQTEVVNRTFHATMKNNTELLQHRVRQRIFYYKCMQEHKRAGQRWVVLIDSDEYLHINYDSLQRFVGNETTFSSHFPIEQSGSVLKLIQSSQHNKNSPLASNLSKTCIQIPRIRYGIRESPKALARTQQLLGPNWTASDFQTLRWRIHAHADNYPINRISKTIINLQQLRDDQLGMVTSIHRPIRELCGQRALHVRAYQHVLRIAHYLGTWEQYSFRDDPRKGDERSKEVSTVDSILETSARSGVTHSFNRSTSGIAMYREEGMILYQAGFTDSFKNMEAKRHRNSLKE